MSIKELYDLFNELERIPGRNDKEYLVKQNMDDDLTYALEILNGEHKLGYTIYIRDEEHLDYEGSLREFLKPFYELPDHSNYSIIQIQRQFKGYGYFLNRLLNRTFRLGIGKSQLKKKITSPMLAKKFEYDMKCPMISKNGYYITEKLDGNRCISYYSIEEGKWKFISRSGKEMNVNFSMDNMARDFIYDGEVLSKKQIENPGQRNFNTLSGIINNNDNNKEDLVYYVFDIISNDPYYVRRATLNTHINSPQVIILSVLQVYNDWDSLKQGIGTILDEVTSRGGEGVMINVGDAPYEQKRTNMLLKLKQVQTMDMKVLGVLEGTGKNEDLVGSLVCEARDNGNIYRCLVGSGLNDYQRYNWAMHNDKIIGKIVEVAYFSTSQDKKADGTKIFSLRFPRLKQVREDKQETSIY